MAFKIPNKGDAENALQARVDSVDIDTMVAAHRRHGVLVTGGVGQGMLVTAQGTPDQTVKSAAGTVFIEGVRTDVVAKDPISLSAAPTTAGFSRYDLIVCKADGTVDKRDGTAALKPEFPTLTVSDVLLAAVFRDTNDNVVAAPEITDKRNQIRQIEMAANILDYGAEPGLGSGSDQWPFIQAAIDSQGAGAGAIYVPPGKYHISKQLNFSGEDAPVAGQNGGFAVIGAGSAASLISITSNWKDNSGPNDYMFSGIADDPDDLVRPFIMQGLQIGRVAISPRGEDRQHGGAGGLANCGGLYLAGFDLVTLNDMLFTGLKGEGVKLNGSQINDFHELRINNCGNSGDDGTVTSATSTTIVDTDRAWIHSGGNNIFDNHYVVVWDPLGSPPHGTSRQVRKITGGTATELTVDSAWDTTPSAGWKYAILVSGQATSGGSAPSTLTDTTKFWSTDCWKGWFVTIVAGKGAYQTKEIQPNTGSTLTVGSAGFDWFTTPDSTSEYVIYKPSMALYLDHGIQQPLTNTSNAPNAILMDNLHLTLNNCASLLIYGDKSASDVPRNILLSNVYGHAQQGFPWPLFDMWFENCSTTRLISGQGGSSRLGPDDMFVPGNVAMASVNFVGSAHAIQQNSISAEYHFANLAVKNGTSYLVRLAGDNGGANEEVEGNDIFINLWKGDSASLPTDTTALDKLIHIDRDASVSHRRNRIHGINSAVSFIGNAFQLDNGAKVIGHHHEYPNGINCKIRATANLTGVVTSIKTKILFDVADHDSASMANLVDDSGTADAAVSTVDGSPGTLTDTRQSWTTDEWAGALVECNGERMRVATNDGDTLTGTGSWTDDPTDGKAYVVSHDKIVVPIDGKYRVEAVLNLGAAVGGDFRILYVEKNDGTQIGVISIPPVANAFISTIAYIGSTVDLLAGDYIEMYGQHNKGSDETFPAAGEYAPTLSVDWIGELD